MNPYALWIMGLVLIYMEFYIPGAIFGIAGGLLLLISLFVYASHSESAIGLIAYLLGIAGSLAFTIWLAIWRIRAAKPDYSIYSDKDQEGYVASHYDEKAIGKRGIVLSDLKPGGYILIAGVQHQALSESGYIEKGSEVQVLRGEGESLIVKRIKKDSDYAADSTDATRR
jgi:membrane-bound ClpP family serine protease